MKIEMAAYMSADGKFAWQGFDDPPELSEAPCLFMADQAGQFLEDLMEQCADMDVDLGPLVLKRVTVEVHD